MNSGAGLFDAALGHATFEGGQADDVFAAAAQALGRAVRHVAQFLDDGQDPVPGVRVDEAGAVNDPGNGCRGHPGPVRHLVDGAHAGAFPGLRDRVVLSGPGAARHEAPSGPGPFVIK